MLTVANALHRIAETYRGPIIRVKRIQAVANSCCAVQTTIISLAVARDEVARLAVW